MLFIGIEIKFLVLKDDLLYTIYLTGCSCDLKTAETLTVRKICFYKWAKIVLKHTEFERSGSFVQIPKIHVGCGAITSGMCCSSTTIILTKKNIGKCSFWQSVKNFKISNWNTLFIYSQILSECQWNLAFNTWFMYMLIIMLKCIRILPIIKMDML